MKKEISTQNSQESLPVLDKVPSKQKLNSQSLRDKDDDDSSSIHTDDGMRDGEMRIYVKDEKTGQTIEKKEKLGYDKLQ